MRVRSIVCILVAFFFIWVSVYAQEWPSADDIIVKIQTEMNLNQQQLVKVKLIIKENMAKRQQIRPQLDLGLTQAQAEPLDTELYLKLSEVLTKYQMDQWNRIHDRMLQETNANNLGN